MMQKQGGTGSEDGFPWRGGSDGEGGEGFISVGGEGDM